MDRPRDSPSPPVWVWLLAVVACTACGSGGAASGAAAVTRVDSAGVELVMTRGIETLPQWKLDSTPIVSIGSVQGGGPDAFSHVTGALALTDGSILVSDNPPAVRLFDSAGRFRRRLVRDGLGPAEVQHAGAPTRFNGDSIAILDPSYGRLVVFDPALAHVSTRKVTGYRDGDSLFAGWLTAISSTEAVGALVRMGRLPPGVTTWRPIILGRVPFDGSAFEPIVSGRGLPLYGLASGMGMGQPLAASTVAAVGQRAVYLGESDEPAIGIWRFDGRQVRSIRWAAVPEPVTPDDRARAYRMDSASWMGSREIQRTRPEFQQRMLAQMKALPAPSHLPYFTHLVPADDGGLWIERRPRPWLDSTGFLVADSTGAIVARIAVPARLTILQVGPDWVLGLWRTADDVPLVRRYRMIR